MSCRSTLRFDVFAKTPEAHRSSWSPSDGALFRLFVVSVRVNDIRVTNIGITLVVRGLCRPALFPCLRSLHQPDRPDGQCVDANDRRLIRSPAKNHPSSNRHDRIHIGVGRYQRRRVVLQQP